MGTMYCMCGLPGSGKTHFAKDFIKANKNVLYFSPDEYYEKINGDSRDRSNTFQIWHTMFQDIHDAAVSDKDVLIDSDNLTFAQRMQWVEWFPEFSNRILFYLELPFGECYLNVLNRTRTIPLKTMEEKAQKWENPSLGRDRENWDNIYRITSKEI